MNIRYLKYYRFIFLSIILLPACTDEGDLGKESEEMADKQVRVKMCLQLPSSSPRTYAISEIDENHIETIDVLAFRKVPADTQHPSGWAFAYRATGTAITDRTDNDSRKSQKQFTVTLTRDNDNEQCLVVLANVRSQLNDLGEITVGQDKDELLATLEYADSYAWNANNGKSDNDPDKTFNPFPMWGEVTLTVDDIIKTIPGINMLRAVARMDVALADHVTNFTLKEVHIYNCQWVGRIVPAPGNLEDGGLRVNAASMPVTPGDYTVNWNYTVPTGMERVFERSIYVMETKAAATDEPQNATCLIVGGTYGTDNAITYYRVDFFKKDDQDNYTGEYADILRNHRYRLNITNVSDRGYSNAGEAFASKPVNSIDYEIARWDNSYMIDVVFDAQYMLAVGPGEFTFSKDSVTEEGEQNRLYIQTDHPDGWKTEIVDADYETPLADEWVKFGSPDNYLGDANEEAIRHLIVSQNNTGGDRSAKIVITAGRLRYEVLVRQTTDVPISLNLINNDTGGEITELLFSSPKDKHPQPRIFTVEWTPVDANPTVMVSPMGSIPAFVFCSYGPVISTGKITGGGYGYESVMAWPEAFYDADFVDNPFPERMSKVDYRVSNEVETLTKTLYLKHIAYNLIHQEAESYGIDGGIHSFTVKSSYPWRAEIIQGSDVITELLTTTGDANTTTGIQVKFRTTDNAGIPQGTARIKFTCLLDGSVTETVELRCTSTQKLEESNCYMLPPGGAPVMIPVSRANAGGITRIGENDTFTAELLWTDHQGGIKELSGKPAAAIDRIAVSGEGSGAYILIAPGAEEGNAVIAVKVNNEIRWSWHIWVTAYDGATSYANNGYTLMDRHLGALTGYATADMQELDYSKTGLLYQWGRKDPTPTGKDAYENGEVVLYDSIGSGSDKRILIAYNSTNVNNLNESVANPTTVYYSSGWSNNPNDWYTMSGTGGNNNLWNAGGAKTEYDPCPKGWRVPQTYAWNGIPYGSTVQNGKTWAGWGYYPFSGYRNSNYTNTLPFSVGYEGYIWTAAASGNQSVCLDFTYSPTTKNSFRQLALPVRCTRE